MHMMPENMGKNDILGGFEHLVLAAAARLRDKESAVSRASGNSVTEEIGAKTERQVSIGAVCTTLDRLERKGFLKSDIGEQDGRRPRRYYSLTESGQHALLEALHAVESIWDGLTLEGDKRPRLNLKAAAGRRPGDTKTRSRDRPKEAR
jgi:PadR family transcriptional regulator PadR